MSAKFPQPRKYEKRRRAEREAETRRRITEAAVELHGSVGPARTTVSALAERAGVQRATVYRHFPDGGALLAACSAHWAAQHPPPDPSPWSAIADPEQRLRTALAALYAFYRSAEPMLSNVIRDAELVPALRETGAPRLQYLAAIEEILAAGWPRAGRRRRRAAIALALDFTTWRTLAARMDDAAATELMARAVVAAAP